MRRDANRYFIEDYDIGIWHYIRLYEEECDHDFNEIVLWCRENFEDTTYIVRATEETLYFYSDVQANIIHFKLRWVG